MPDDMTSGATVITLDEARSEFLIALNRFLRAADVSGEIRRQEAAATISVIQQMMALAGVADA